MEFKLTRTSDWNGEKPLEGNSKFAERLKTSSKNEWGETEHTIELNTLEELLEFEKEQGRFILDSENDVPSIEIYDDYRE